MKKLSMITFDKKNDLIAIIAPASSCTDAPLKLHQQQELLTAYGFKTITDEQIFAKSTLPFVAAPREKRLRILKESILNPEVKIIFAFRGGYGCTEIMEECVNFRPTVGKILIGFSDITALHMLFNQHYQMPSIHGPVLTSLSSQKPGIERIIEILQGQDSNIELVNINNPAANSIKGELTGGNLTVFCNLLATSLHPVTADKILIFEDVNEKAYRIHRYLMHLKNANIFQGVKAVIFGDFIKGEEDIFATILDFCQQHIAQTPAYRAIGIGHGEVNFPIILGNKVEIANGHLLIPSPFGLI